MFNNLARITIAPVIDPIARFLVRLGLTPNAMTVVGSVFSVAAALWFFPHGDLVAGSIVVPLFLVFDLFDGSMARASGTQTRFGAVLDAGCDRIVDGVLFGSIAWWALVIEHNELVGVSALAVTVFAQVISYVKARAEASGLAANGGLVERAGRFIIGLTATGLQGFGVPRALDIGLPLLAVLCFITVIQRFVAAARSERELANANV
jgi:CDP-diacylglycerol--glycerol-3-phosphate 3-phosphatidyltransferase